MLPYRAINMPHSTHTIDAAHFAMHCAMSHHQKHASPYQTVLHCMASAFMLPTCLVEPAQTKTLLTCSPWTACSTAMAQHHLPGLSTCFTEGTCKDNVSMKWFMIACSHSWAGRSQHASLPMPCCCKDLYCAFIDLLVNDVSQSWSGHLILRCFTLFKLYCRHFWHQVKMFMFRTNWTVADSNLTLQDACCDLYSTCMLRNKCVLNDGGMPCFVQHQTVTEGQWVNWPQSTR